MNIEMAGKPARSGYARRIAFLREAADPAKGAPASVRGELRQACRAAAFGGREKETAGVGGWTLYGLGKAAEPFSKLRRTVRKALHSALRHARGRILVAFGDGVEAPAFKALLPLLAQADYAFERYKSRLSRRARVSGATVLPPGATAAAAWKAAAREAQVVAAAAAWARDLGNTPANDLGPVEFSREVRAMCRGRRIALRVLGKREIARERMAGVLGVNAGSARPPQFVIGQWRPARAKKTVVLVGKGITFDSGGISIKPAASMGEMKYDMMGAATVFAVLRGAHDLALPVRVVALAPVTENMPGGRAQRPGDILRMRNGKTVEVDNTDAEGRLVLADALSYAEKYKPDVLLDFATLTGAVLVALGQECAGLMTEDDRLSRDLVHAGEATGERLWRLPLWDEYRENLKSEWADMKNTGGRSAGTINAGLFLKEFAPPGVSWAHIDFAGTAHLEKEHAGWDAGATGFGVALALEFLKARFAR
ncbi:MAG: leucyl aminopeptidase family protein [Thermoanaerobaculia bacterium]